LDSLWAVLKGTGKLLGNALITRYLLAKSSFWLGVMKNLENEFISQVEMAQNFPATVSKIMATSVHFPWVDCLQFLKLKKKKMQ
jgi:hypothetical protein